LWYTNEKKIDEARPAIEVRNLKVAAASSLPSAIRAPSTSPLTASLAASRAATRPKKVSSRPMPTK
jgi:hypothetical protein